jgi:hypothetical protein
MIDLNPWYPLNTFKRFPNSVCGSACTVCKGFALEIEKERERPCPRCYPGTAASRVLMASKPIKNDQINIVHASGSLDPICANPGERKFLGGGKKEGGKKL